MVGLAYQEAARVRRFIRAEGSCFELKEKDATRKRHARFPSGSDETGT
jgi:hypothetical protein